MDLPEAVSAISTSGATRNTTEIVIIEEDEIQPMTIIVWCLGGILLISLLSLLGRIILAKKKQPFEYFDYFEHVPVTENRNLLRIRVDGGNHDTTTQSRDTVSLVPASDATVPDTTALNITSTIVEPPQTNVNAHYNPSFGAQNRQQIEPQRQINTRHLQSGEHRVYPTPRTAVILHPDHYGSRATINGYIIRPPPYREVVDGPSRIPSVIVARDQSHVVHTRRQMFSL